MKSHLRWLIFIGVLVVAALWVIMPGNPGISLDSNGDGVNDVNVTLAQPFGLDIVGGLRVLLEAELPPGSFTTEDLRGAANNVSRRVNALGVGEATIQVQGSSRILVELPGVTDPRQAIDTIQKTALLEFVDFAGLQSQVDRYVGQHILTDQQLLIQQQRQASQLSGTQPSATDQAPELTPEATAAASPDTGSSDVSQPGLPNPLTGQPFRTVMTGAGLQAAAAHLDQQGRWIIQFELTPEGGQVFGPYTGANRGQPMAIVLDGVVLSAPTIQAQLDTGGIITGRFTEDEAKTLALQLRSGALPIPLRVLSSETVGATLGQESVNLSIRAGVLGVIVILAFMLVNYRVPGIAASMALLVFIALNLAIFRLLPVTLTLPAIVGFLISIGSAVDGNILIFERMREELRAGKEVDAAIEEGFSRAWSSIRDSNFSTILICSVLFLFGQTPGASIVSGFAVTLILGLLVNLFTAVLVTRTFLHILMALFRRPVAERSWLMGV